MNQLQMLKMALISYVNSAKAIWSAIAHPLAIVGSKKCNLKDYRIYAGGKNLLDVKKWYPDYANDEGGITYTEKDFVKIYKGVKLESGAYTFSANYEVYIEPWNWVGVYFFYTDGSYDVNRFASNEFTKETITATGTVTLKSNPNKIISHFAIGYAKGDAKTEVKLTNMQIEEGTSASEYEPYQYTDNFPITIRGKNYFDLDKVPFSDLTTLPYNNGLKAVKTSRDNRGNKIPISLPLNKEIIMTMEVVDSKIEGATERITMGFFNKSGTRVRSTLVTSTKGKKTYIFTLSEEVSYVQFYLQADNEQNVVGDYVTMDNIMLRTEGDDSYEGYIEPQTIDISLDEPLGAGEVIQKSVDNLPNLPQFKGTTVYEVQADTPPSGIEVCYYG